MGELIKTTIFFIVIFSLLIYLVVLNHNNSNKVTIDGEDFIRSGKQMKNGNYQVIFVPCDTKKEKK